ncbi:esterase family protein [Actinoallomurus spadix]|uniref:Alpha/beta hydrolase-fold protein n=1 Tax=Actinoallomurus spadix TaxID=79912 RepID=A0ABP3GG51_9ACTN|nr:esterase family protein [Actinoallomurus spadix]MCO5990932.1 esterase family protein [Actinoallomurus spadix]
MSIISRRGALIAGLGGLTVLAGAGAAYGLVEEDVLPGRYRLAQHLGRCGSMPPLPRIRPGTVEQAEFRTPGGGTARVLLGYPGAVTKGLPVVVMLHGSDGDARTPFDTYGVHYHLADAVRRGVAPFAVAAIDDWAGPGWRPSPVTTRSLLPFLRHRGLATTRIGLLGWSIGGRGALLLAAERGPARVAAVAAASPALSGADVTALARTLGAVPASLTCGRDDAFATPAKNLLARLRAARRAEVTGGIHPGCHDAAFRRRMLPAQIEFLGRHLSRA